MSRALIALVVPAALLSASCAATYHRFRFEPAPAEVLVQPDPAQPPRARGLVSILDGHRTPARTHELRVRLRLENLSQEPLTIEEDALELVGSDLTGFGPVRLEPPEWELGPRAVQTYEIWFTYPAGMPISAPSVDGLQLSMGLAWPGGRVGVSVPFSRVEPVVVDGYPRWHIGVGYSVHH